MVIHVHIYKDIATGMHIIATNCQVYVATSNGCYQQGYCASSQFSTISN